MQHAADGAMFGLVKRLLRFGTVQWRLPQRTCAAAFTLLKQNWCTASASRKCSERIAPYDLAASLQMISGCTFQAAATDSSATSISETWPSSAESWLISRISIGCRASDT